MCRIPNRLKHIGIEIAIMEAELESNQLIVIRIAIVWVESGFEKELPVWVELESIDLVGTQICDVESTPGQSHHQIRGIGRNLVKKSCNSKCFQ